MKFNSLKKDKLRNNKMAEKELLKALMEGELEIVKRLISSGVDIETKYEGEDTPLAIASYYGHLEIVEFLVNSGANIEARDRFNNTPLILSVISGHLEVAKLLILLGADIEAEDDEEMTCLDYFSGNKYRQELRYLSECRSSISLKPANIKGF